MKMPVRVLFICTANACRSQMAEAILAHRGGSRFRAFSAGAQPAGYVHPLAIAALEAIGVPLPGEARSKAIDEFLEAEMDVVITVCDSAAAACPQWPGEVIRAHWPLPDPVALHGTPQQRQEAAVAVARDLVRRIDALIALPWETTDRATLQRALGDVGGARKRMAE